MIATHKEIGKKAAAEMALQLIEDDMIVGVGTVKYKLVLLFKPPTVV